MRATGSWYGDGSTYPHIKCMLDTEGTQTSQLLVGERWGHSLFCKHPSREKVIPTRKRALRSQASWQDTGSQDSLPRKLKFVGDIKVIRISVKQQNQQVGQGPPKLDPLPPLYPQDSAGLGHKGQGRRVRRASPQPS